MQITPQIFPRLINAISIEIEKNIEEITVLDQVIGDGDHITNLQRGVSALQDQQTEISQLSWAPALQKIGMTLLSTMGGASGSLFGTLFISMSKAMDDQKEINQQHVSDVFYQGVEAVKRRGKADKGEKTMLDVLIPVAEEMKIPAKTASLTKKFLANICKTAIQGVESTREMIATKGRSSYLQEKSIGHIDAGARTSQLIICTIINELSKDMQDPILDKD